jgi:phage terminase small subunit
MKTPRDTTAVTAELRLIRGTTRKDRPAPSAVAAPMLGEPPPPPDWMTNQDARAEWDKLTRILALSEATLSSLGVLCQLHAKIVASFRAGDVPPAAHLAMHRSLSGDFGLTPRAQHRLQRRIGKDTPTNPFANRGIKPPR